MKPLGTIALAVVFALANIRTNAADSQEPVVLKGHTSRVTAVAWADDGKSLATAGDDRSIRVWDSVTGKPLADVQGIARTGYGGPVIAFTADLKRVAVNYWGEIAISTVAVQSAESLLAEMAGLKHNLAWTFNNSGTMRPPGNCRSVS